MVARNNKRTMLANLFILTLSFLRIEGSVLLGWGSRFFLDYAFYQYFQDNSISFLRFSQISEGKAFFPVSVDSLRNLSTSALVMEYSGE